MNEELVQKFELILEKKFENYFKHLNSIYYILEEIKKRIGNLEFDLKPIDSHILNMDIDNFDLTIRTTNVLKKVGVKKVRDLCLLTELDLLQIRECGRKTITEIKNFLDSHSLRLNMGD